MSGSNLYDSNGTFIQAIDLDEAEAEYIHGLKRTNTGVEVYILDGAVEERIVTVDAPLS